MSSGMVADGSVAYAKTTTTLYEQAAGPEPTPKTSSWTARKARESGKRNGTATMVSKRSQRSGVMNRKSASRDELFRPSHLGKYACNMQNMSSDLDRQQSTLQSNILKNEK